MSNSKLMIVDGNSIANRAFYGLQGPQLLATSSGFYTNAIYGFLNILFKYVEEENPEYICVAFDMQAPTFRHKEFDGYKAKRKGMPPELAVQMPVIKDVLDAMNIKRLEYEGYEADDIIGAVSLSAEKSGIDVIIVTGDRDSLQLASEKTRIKIPSTRAGKTDTVEYDYYAIIEKYGVEPFQLIDVKALMGDQSDNIPGVPGIGEKTALELIKRFGSIEKLYENIDQLEKKSVKEKLVSNRDLAFLSKKLATIARDMPIFWDSIDALKRRDFDYPRLYELFKNLEFKSFIERLKLSPERAAGNQKHSVEITFKTVKESKDLAPLVKKLAEAQEFAIYYLIDKTGDFSNRLAGVVFSTNGCITEVRSEIVYIDLVHGLNEDEFLESFRPVFENGEIKKCGHDIKNFILYLKRRGIRFEGLRFDTMVAAYIIDPSRETYSVSELSSEYLNLDIEPLESLSGKGKSFVRYADMDASKLVPAACRHAAVLIDLMKVMDRKIEADNQHYLFYGIELPLVEVLADMEYHGFKVNIDGLKEFSSELEEKINQVAEDIYMLAGEKFNINSTKQLGSILFEKLGLPPVKKTKTGYSTDAEVLEELSSKHDIVVKILEYRQLVKLKSTYVEGLLNVADPVTHKIHSSFNQTVTATGRISSTEPNLQNIPVKIEMGRKIRKVFIPESDEFVLLDADYSQIELRVLAHITKDENMISAFKNDEDIHTATASQVFGVPKGQVTPLMRARAKAVNFGIVYGIGDFSLAKDLGVSRKQAKKYIEEYFAKYPKVKLYMHKIVEKARAEGFVSTIFNRRRYLPELKSKNFSIRSFGERVAMNTPIQGSAADIIKIAMVKVYRELSKNNMRSRLILQVHDELLVEACKDEKEQVLKILKECMENAVQLEVPLKVEVACGNNWYETK